MLRFIPEGLLFFLVINGTLMLLLSFSRVAMLRKRDFPSLPPEPEHLPFVSIHMPICDVSPERLQQALRALASLDYPSYEVIILDNTASDTDRWHFIEAECRSLGEQFRFYHREGIIGNKAEALNICYTCTTPAAEVIAIIDADYVVASDFLKVGVAHLTTDKRRGSVQFAHAYANVETPLRSLYERFPDIYMQGASALRTALPTGTLTLIRKEVMKRVGLWFDASINEDTELGLRILDAGYEGVYLSRKGGEGLAPLQMKQLHAWRQQRMRGNARTFRALVNMPGQHYSTKQRWSLLTLLTARFNFTLIPALITLICGVVLAFTGMQEFILMILPLTLSLMLAEFLLTLPRFFIKSDDADTISFRERIKAWYLHFGFLFEEGISWWWALWRDHPSSWNNSKTTRGKARSGLLPGVIVGIGLAGTGGLLMSYQGYLLGILTIISGLPFLAVLYLRSILRRTPQSENFLMDHGPFDSETLKETTPA